METSAIDKALMELLSNLSEDQKEQLLDMLQTGELEVLLDMHRTGELKALIKLRREKPKVYKHLLQMAVQTQNYNIIGNYIGVQ